MTDLADAREHAIDALMNPTGLAYLPTRHGLGLVLDPLIAAASADVEARCPMTLDGMRCDSYAGHPEHAHIIEGTLATLYEDLNAKEARLGAALKAACWHENDRRADLRAQLDTVAHILSGAALADPQEEGVPSPLACAYCGTFHDSTACPPELHCHVCDHPLGTTAPAGCPCDCHPPGGAS